MREMIPMIRLYDLTERSGHCYKVKLLLGLLGLDYERVPIDRKRQENRTAEFLKLNPRGQVPVLNDAGSVIWDSQAILGYLGAKYGGGKWWPDDPTALAQVLQWLAVAQGEIQLGLQRARAIKNTGRPGSLEEAQETATRVLGILDERLREHEWLALDRPTVADVACYPYVAMAPEGDVALDPHPAVCHWLARIRGLPGYVAIPPAE
jgi:glutathione S-transferase